MEPLYFQHFFSSLLRRFSFVSNLFPSFGDRRTSASASHPLKMMAHHSFSIARTDFFRAGMCSRFTIDWGRMNGNTRSPNAEIVFLEYIFFLAQRGNNYCKVFQRSVVCIYFLSRIHCIHFMVELTTNPERIISHQYWLWHFQFIRLNSLCVCVDVFERHHCASDANLLNKNTIRCINAWHLTTAVVQPN